MFFKYRAKSKEFSQKMEENFGMKDSKIHLHEAPDGVIHKTERGSMEFFNYNMESYIDLIGVEQRDLSHLFDEEALKEPLLFEEVYRLSGTEFLLHLNVFGDNYTFYWTKFIPYDDDEPVEVEFLTVYEGSPKLVQEELMFNFDVFGEE